MSLTRTSKRLVSLDVLRGITVCGMILVNNAGACGYAYAPLKHAKWDGFTPADLAFFLFFQDRFYPLTLYLVPIIINVYSLR